MLAVMWRDANESERSFLWHVGMALMGGEVCYAQLSPANDKSTHASAQVLMPSWLYRDALERGRPIYYDTRQFRQVDVTPEGRVQILGG
jgi:hypothetical protein